MVSSIETLRTIERSIADHRREEKSLLDELERGNGALATLVEQRTAAIRELAEVRTRDAVSDGVITQADQLQHKVESALIARQKTIESLRARDGTADAKRDEFKRAEQEIRKEIDELEAQLDRAATEAKRQLAGEPDYQLRKETLAAAEETFTRADEKTRRAEADYSEKGRAYETDPLFMYLWNRRYGAADYRPNWLIRMGDDYVAKLVGYHDARANYAVLGDIPTRLRAHCDALAKEVAAARQRVDDLEAERVKVVAGSDLLSLLTAARERHARVLKELEAVEAEITEVSGQLQRYGEGTDDSLKEAIDLAAGFLEQESYQQLVSVARTTEQPTDDLIVGRIGEIDRKTADLKQETAEKRRQLEDIAKRRKELMDVAQKFRRNHYDEPGSILGPDDAVERLLRELLRGAITAGDYWARTQRRRGWDERPADPFRRGAGLPPFGDGWGSGGGWGSRNGGDDFRTGGGF